MDVAELFGWVGGVLVVARLVPQAVRLLRTGTAAGVSRVGAVCWLGNDLGWLTYGLRADLVPLWLPSLCLVALDLLVVGLLVPRSRVRDLAPGAAWIATVVAAAVAGQAALGVALIVGSATGNVPHAWRALRADDLSGVSRATWLLAVGDGVLWGVYGAANEDAAVTWYAGLTLLTGAVVLWRIRATAERPGHPDLRPV